jgi:hypothetical protein
MFDGTAAPFASTAGPYDFGSGQAAVPTRFSRTFTTTAPTIRTPSALVEAIRRMVIGPSAS